MRAKILLVPLLAALGVVLLLTNCTTTYDAQGRPVTTVTPEGAALGAVAAGLVGYAIADDDDGYKKHYRRGYGGYGGYGYHPQAHRYGHPQYGRYGGGYCR